MKIETETYVLPVYWASALVNGDESGLEQGDIDQMNAFLAKHPSMSCCDVGESYFAHRNDATSLGGDVAEYTFLIHARQGSEE